MNAYGFCVSTKSVDRRRKDLIKKHTKLCKEMYGTPKEALESACRSQAALADHCLEKVQGKASLKPHSLLLEMTVPDSTNPDSTHQWQDAVSRCSPLLLGDCSIPIFSMSGQHRVFIYHESKDNCDSECKEYVMNQTVVFSDPQLEGPACPDVSFIKAGYMCDYEVIGDNFDLMIDRTVMTKSRQRKSVHWFLLIAKKKSVTFPELEIDGPKRDIMTISTNEWLPTDADMESYDINLDFHTAHILVQYLDFLKPYEKCLPRYIPHPYIDKVSKKSEILTCDILDESENSNEGMISINKKIHEEFIPRDENGEVADRIVFWGDVLTNERAFTAQQHIINGHTSFSRTAGVIHRPEGFHRQMNLVLVDLLLMCISSI